VAMACVCVATRMACVCMRVVMACACVVMASVCAGGLYVCPASLIDQLWHEDTLRNADVNAAVFAACLGCVCVTIWLV
jgi:hypothetical protein